MTIQVEVLWVVTPYSVVLGYKHFRGLCYLHGPPKHHYTALQPRRPQLEASLLWNPQNLHDYPGYGYKETEVIPLSFGLSWSTCIL